MSLLLPTMAPCKALLCYIHIMNSYELLSQVTASNPSITHFLLRMYKRGTNLFLDKKENFSYQWVRTDELDQVENHIQQFESQGFMVALTSIVMTEQGIQSLILLDFAVAQSAEVEQELVNKISTFNQSGDVNYRMDGWLIKTNASYHYLGNYVTSQENFRNFLGSALLFRHKDQGHFVVDDRWMGHQLKRGYGTIRIGQKEGMFPQVIAEIK